MNEPKMFTIICRLAYFICWHLPIQIARIIPSEIKFWWQYAKQRLTRRLSDTNIAGNGGEM